MKGAGKTSLRERAIGNSLPDYVSGDDFMTSTSALNTTQSSALYERACKAIPGGVNSPVRAFRSVGGTPLFMESGQGCRLRDADGNEFLDFCSSWGPLISGHRHPDIVTAVKDQADKALTFGTPCEGEVLLAEFILSRLNRPGMEKIRFVNSGTEAVMSALRLARGFTGRDKIIKFEGCYHGHSDSLLVKAGSGLATLGTPDSAGVPADFTQGTIVLPLDDENAVREAFKNFPDSIAALILEPVPANNGLLLQRPEFLKFLREVTRENGTLLIFDEVISGFRLGFGGAAEKYGIDPDLAAYGKIIGGGMPVGAFAGRSEIFEKLAPDGPVYQAGTLSGNPVAMAAGLAQLKLLTPEFYAHLEKLTGILRDEFNAAGRNWKIESAGSIFWFYRGKDAPRRADQIEREAMTEYAAFHAHCLERGLYLAPSGYEVGFMSSPMEEKDVRALLDAALEFFRS